jgi:hypothetical protein
MQELTIERNTTGSGRFGITLYLAVMGGMGVSLFIGQFLQNPILITLLVLGVMTVIISSMIFKGKYTFNDEGIREELRPYTGRFSLARPRIHFFPWSSIKSYKLDHELNRSYGEKWYLKIHFMHPAYTMTIFEGKTESDALEFNAVRDYFLEKVDETVSTTSAVHTPTASIHPAHPAVPLAKHVRRERSFYAKPFARVLNTVFTLFAIAAIYFLMERWVSGKPFTSGFRLAVVKLSIVIIPGIFYMRSRIQAARKEEREHQAAS